MNKNIIFIAVSKKRSVEDIKVIYEQGHRIFGENYVNELLDHLKDKGVKIVLLTGRSKESTEISLAYFGLNKYFTKVYTGSKNGSNKSFNFTKVMKDFSCSSKDIIYIGDSKKDVQECQKSNIKILSINFDNERLAKIKEINNLSYSSFIELEKELNKYL